MRTRTEVRNDMDSLDRAVGACNDPEAAGLVGVRLMKDSLLRRRYSLEQELALASSADLHLILDGPAVIDHTIDIDQLVRIVSPFEKAIAAVAQALSDAATSTGVIPATIRQASTLRVKATYAGSFGMALSGPPPTSEPVLFGEDQPLFERAVTRVVDVIDAGADPESYEQRVIDQVSELGPRAVSNLTQMAKGAADVGGTVEILWTEPGTTARRSVISPVIAARLQQVLTHLQAEDTETNLSGRLVEISLPKLAFGLQQNDDSIVRGAVSPDLAAELLAQAGRTIEAVARTTRTWSTTSGREVVRHTLIHINPNEDRSDAA